jgi:conjugal transfer mating pair stabilization protein TraG
MASLSRSNGYQISDDMSQVIASRYAEMAASPEFRDLGAPSLTNTTPSPHQREVRNMIVGRILEQYAAEAWRRFGRGWIRLRRWGVPGPAEFSMPQATPRPQGRRSAGSAARHAPQGSADGSPGTAHHAPGDDAAAGAAEGGD